MSNGGGEEEDVAAKSIDGDLTGVVMVELVDENPWRLGKTERYGDEILRWTEDENDGAVDDPSPSPSAARVYTGSESFSLGSLLVSISLVVSGWTKSTRAAMGDGDVGPLTTASLGLFMIWRVY
jgi:hypothetical protein